MKLSASQTKLLVYVNGHQEGVRLYDEHPTVRRLLKKQAIHRLTHVRPVSDGGEVRSFYAITEEGYLAMHKALGS